MERVEPRVTVKRMVEWYGCCPKTAGKYIRQMPGFMENPLSATMDAFREWEADRVAKETVKPQKQKATKRQSGRVVVPRHR